MNINENYGDIEMPSQIADSFEANFQQGSDSLKQSQYLDDEIQRNSSSGQLFDQSNFNLDSSIEDTFLENLPKIATHSKSKQEEPRVSLSRNEIVRQVPPGQAVIQAVQIINSTSHPTIVAIKTVFQIASKTLKNKQIKLEPWEKKEVTFKILKPEQEFGDLFETITFESKFENPSSHLSANKKNAFIEVIIRYVTPTLKIKYEGCSDVITLGSSRISLNKLSRNKSGKYQIELQLQGIERLSLAVETRGDFQLFPNEIVFYENEVRKITFQESKGGLHKGAVILRATEAKVIYAFGVELI